MLFTITDKTYINEITPFYPSVFAVGDEYQIFIPFKKEAVVRAEVGGEAFYDECNGVLRSNNAMHRVSVPRDLLDREKAYAIVYNVITERKAYFTTSEPDVRMEFSFRPVPEDGDVRIYHIADAHNLTREPILAAGYFGEKPDVLVMNGDIPDHSGNIENFTAIYEIASTITEGTRPVVYARGNHDCRGTHAEDMPLYTPTYNGNTYYTFRLGSIWGLVLDCGEDKDDTSTEYGTTVCFRSFRKRETEYIRSVIKNAEREYAAPGVKHRLIVSHIPFAYKNKPPFDIEEETYREWARLMREEIRPTLMIHGHEHVLEISPVGGKYDTYGQPCVAVIGAKPIKGEHNDFYGCAMTLGENGTEVVFNGSTGDVVRCEIIK